MPPNIQQNFPGRQSWLSHGLHWITTISPLYYYKWLSFHHLLPSLEKEDQHCCDSAVICKWIFGSIGLFVPLVWHSHIQNFSVTICIVIYTFSIFKLFCFSIPLLLYSASLLPPKFYLSTISASASAPSVCNTLLLLSILFMRSVFYFVNNIFFKVCLFLDNFVFKLLQSRHSRFLSYEVRFVSFCLSSAIEVIC